MNEKLDELNRATAEAAQTDFINCCGSQNWARKMTEARPFADLAALLKHGEEIWLNLETEDWLEAFAAHPKIGARKAAPQQQARAAEWSRGEQAGTYAATETMLEQLAEANCLYENKFGYIFIVCASGESAEEMLELCKERINNDADSELRVAACEQRKITEIRLKKLLEIE